jgi:glyoxylase-like metal-dependent hydrolase (beta-lactamase superfamily II)
MKTYQIFPLLTGSSEMPDKRISTYICYLIKGDSKAILVDTGQSSNELCAINHKAHRMLNEKDGGVLLLEELKKHGVEQNDIELLVNTHLHWDHCYNNDLFPKARIYVQRSEIIFALDPVPPQYIFYEIDTAKEGLQYWAKCANRFESIDGDYKLCEGIDLLALPGHTPGFQGVLVNTEAGRYLIGGDTIPFLANWETRTYGLPQPSNIYTDLSAFYESLKKMVAATNYVLPGHDKRVFEHSVYPF